MWRVRRGLLDVTAVLPRQLAALPHPIRTLRAANRGIWGHYCGQGTGITCRKLLCRFALTGLPFSDIPPNAWRDPLQVNEGEFGGPSLRMPCAQAIVNGVAVRFFAGTAGPPP